MSGLFASITPSFHSRVIDLDKAIRLPTANQKHLRLSDFARVDDLRTIYLTSFGVGPDPQDGESKAPQSIVQDLPFLEAESPATTGIDAAVVAQHLNAQDRKSVV